MLLGDLPDPCVAPHTTILPSAWLPAAAWTGGPRVAWGPLVLHWALALNRATTKPVPLDLHSPELTAARDLGCGSTQVLGNQPDRLAAAAAAIGLTDNPEIEQAVEAGRLSCAR